MAKSDLTSFYECSKTRLMIIVATKWNSFSREVISNFNFCLGFAEKSYKLAGNFRESLPSRGTRDILNAFNFCLLVIKIISLHHLQTRSLSLRAFIRMCFSEGKNQYYISHVKPYQRCLKRTSKATFRWKKMIGSEEPQLDLKTLEH